MPSESGFPKEVYQRGLTVVLHETDAGKIVPVAAKGPTGYMSLQQAAQGYTPPKAKPQKSKTRSYEPLNLPRQIITGSVVIPASEQEKLQLIRASDAQVGAKSVEVKPLVETISIKPDDLQRVLAILAMDRAAAEQPKLGARARRRLRNAETKPAPSA